MGPRAGGWGMPSVLKFHRCVPVDECTAYTLKSKLFPRGGEGGWGGRRKAECGVAYGGAPAVVHGGVAAENRRARQLLLRRVVQPEQPAAAGRQLRRNVECVQPTVQNASEVKRASGCINNCVVFYGAGGRPDAAVAWDSEAPTLLRDDWGRRGRAGRAGRTWPRAGGEVAMQYKLQSQLPT